MSDRRVLAIAAAAVVVVTAVVLAFALGDDDDGKQAAAPQATATEDQRPTTVAEERGGGPPDDRGQQGGPPQQDAEPVEDLPDELKVDRSKPEPGIPSPATVEPSGRRPAAAVERELGTGDRRKDGTIERRVIGARCAGGACTLRVRVGPEGGGINVAGQAPALRSAFRRTATDSVTIYVYHHTTGNKDPETTPFMTITCRRSDGPRMERITPDQVERRCTIERPRGGEDKGPRERGRGNR